MTDKNGDANQPVDSKGFFKDLEIIHNLLDDYAHDSSFDSVIDPRTLVVNMPTTISNKMGMNFEKFKIRMDGLYRYSKKIEHLIPDLLHLQSESHHQLKPIIRLIINRLVMFQKSETHNRYVDKYLDLFNSFTSSNDTAILVKHLQNSEKYQFILDWSLEADLLKRELKTYFDFTDPSIWITAVNYINEISVEDYFKTYVAGVSTFDKYELLDVLALDVQKLEEEKIKSLFLDNINKYDERIQKNVSNSTEHAAQIEKVLKDANSKLINIEAIETSNSTNKYGLAFENQYKKSTRYFQLIWWLASIVFLAGVGGGYIVWTIFVLESLARESTITTSVFVLSAITRVSVIPILLIVIWFFINQYNKQKFIIEEYAHKKTLVFAISTFQDNLKDEQSHVKDHFFKSFFDALSTSPIQAFMQKNQKSESEMLVDLTREVLTSQLKSIDSATIINSTIKANDNPDKAGKGG